MALNPKLRKMIADAHAKYGTNVHEADDKARDDLVNLISNGFKRLRATPSAKHINYRREAEGLLEEIEMWTEGYDPNGRLIFIDPADEVTRDNAV